MKKKAKIIIKTNNKQLKKNKKIERSTNNFIPRLQKKDYSSILICIKVKRERYKDNGR